MWHIEVKEFTGFTDEDFDAFQQVKWGNNRYNLERMKVQSKLKALEKELTPFIRELSLPLSSDVTIHYPHIFNNRRVDSLWLYYTRSGEEQKELAFVLDKKIKMEDVVQNPSPLNKHIIVGINIHEQGILIATRLHKYAWVDHQNFLNKLDNTWEKTKFLSLIKERTDFTLFFDHESSTIFDTVDITHFSRVKEKIEKIEEVLQIMKQYHKTLPVVRTRDFIETLREDCGFLFKLYRFIAWSKGNDFISAKKVLKEERETGKELLNKNDKVRIVRGVFKGEIGIVLDATKKDQTRVLVKKIPVILKQEDLKKI